MFDLQICSEIENLENDIEISFDDWLIINQLSRELKQIENALNIFTENVSNVTIDEFIKISNAVIKTTPNEQILHSLFNVLAKKKSNSVKVHRLVSALKSRREQFEPAEQEDKSRIKLFFECLVKCTK